MAKEIKKKNIFKQVDENLVVNSQPKRDVIVKLRNVDVQFGLTKYATKAMKNVSFNIYRGEVLGLVGESGSGKSTTGNAIMGLLNRRYGSINVDGTEIKPLARQMGSKFRKDFALKAQMIFQDPTNSLNPQKTVKQIISEGLNNVNLIGVFSKQYDIFTVTRLSLILKGQEQPSYVAKLNIKNLIEEITNEEFDKVFDIIYVKAKNELLKFATPQALKAATFLDLRKAEREYYLPLNQKPSIKKIKEHMINEVIKSVGLSKQILNRYPLEFSGGQQQRISISRTVVIKPSLIVADEPISALDVSIQAQVINIFNDLKRKLGFTILFIAHDLRMVEYISDRIAVMYKGRILEIGKAEEITKNPIHPYTKALLASVPSIDKVNQNLSEVKYDEKIHRYDEENKPLWFQVNKDEHFVYMSKKEAKKWM